MIKVKVLETNKVRILLVDGLPEDAEIFGVLEGGWTYEITDDTLMWIDPKDHKFPKSYYIPPGNWQALNFLDKVTEGEAKHLIDSDIGFTSKGVAKTYKHYPIGFYFETALQSLRSLVEANVKLRNQYGEKPVPGDCDSYDHLEGGNILHTDEIEEYYHDLEQWEAEEKQVYHNPFILIEKK